MGCSNCYNGCVEVTSDQCIRYTGIDVPVLGIKTGDSLSYVEQALIEFLTSTLDGTGIKLTINPTIICEIVEKNLVQCDDLTLVNIINALIKATCELDQRLSAVEGELETLEGSYTVGCLTGVTASSGTHAILQATITKLCGLELEVEAIATDLDTNYVKLADLNDLIAAYLASVGASTKFYNRMVPFTVVEYYGDITGKFDTTGAGYGDWEKIYLCNGNNGTPDKRGRVAVGVTSGMGGGPMSPVVDPAVSTNPSYVLRGLQGANSVVLSTAQLPAHTHLANATVTDPGHSHVASNTSAGIGGGGKFAMGSDVPEGAPSVDTSVTGISVEVINSNTGSNQGHINYQPGIGCYFIMYIP